MSIFSQSVVQKALRNILSLSKMILLGTPKCTHASSNNMFATSCPLMGFLKGMVMHILLNMSITTIDSDVPSWFLEKHPQNPWICSPMV